jgi:hypothetical protein
MTTPIDRPSARVIVIDATENDPSTGITKG